MTRSKANTPPRAENLSTNNEEIKAHPENMNENSTAIVKAELPTMPEIIRQAFIQLRDDIFALDSKPNFVTLVMAINVDTAKADLIPIPTLDNMIKLQEHLEKFPEAVQTAIKKNIPEKDMQASKEIWNFLASNKEIRQIAQESLSTSAQKVKKEITATTATTT